MAMAGAAGLQGPLSDVADRITRDTAVSSLAAAHSPVLAAVRGRQDGEVRHSTDPDVWDGAPGPASTGREKAGD